MAFMDVLYWLAGPLLIFLALTELFRHKFPGLHACVRWVGGFLWQCIAGPAAPQRVPRSRLQIDDLRAESDRSSEMKKLAKFLPSNEAVSTGMQRTVNSMTVDLACLVQPIYHGTREARREALSECAQNFKSVDLLQPGTMDPFFFAMKGRVLKIGLKYAQVLSDSMKAAADGVVYMKEGLNLFDVLKATRDRPHSIGDIIESLEELNSIAETQSKKAAAVMEGFNDVLTRLVAEEMKGKECIVRKLEAATEAEKNAKNSRDVAKVAGGAAVVLGLTVITGGLFGVGAAAAAAVGVAGHIAVGSAAVVGTIGAVGSGVAAVDSMQEGAAGRALAIQHGQAARDLSSMVRNIREIEDHVKPFHTFWTILHMALDQIILGLKKGREDYDEKARISYLKVDRVVVSWKEAIVLQYEYMEDLNMEIKRLQAP